MILDFHNHYYPPEYVAACRRGESSFKVTEDAQGNPVLHSPGDYNVLVPGHRDLDARARDLDAAGVDAAFKAVTRIAGELKGPTGPANRKRVEYRRFQQDMARRRGNFAVLAAHHPGQGNGFVGVGNDQEPRREGVLRSVNGQERFPLT